MMNIGTRERAQTKERTDEKKGQSETKKEREMCRSLARFSFSSRFPLSPPPCLFYLPCLAPSFPHFKCAQGRSREAGESTIAKSKIQQVLCFERLHE